jgi:hypothetical protein
MMKRTKQKLALDQLAVYQIKVPGELDESLTDWVSGMTLKVGPDDDGLPFTTLVVSVNQVALQGLLQRLYSLGLPFSVICVDCS